VRPLWGGRCIFQFAAASTLKRARNGRFTSGVAAQAPMGSKLVRAPHGDGPKLGKLLRKTYRKWGQKRGVGKNVTQTGKSVRRPRAWPEAPTAQLQQKTAQAQRWTKKVNCAIGLYKTFPPLLRSNKKLRGPNRKFRLQQKTAQAQR
jgi:hypothetical protein